MTAAGRAALEALRQRNGVTPSPPAEPSPRGARAAQREAEHKRRLDEHIKRVVDAAPPLTPEQRDRLRQLLRPARELQ